MSKIKELADKIIQTRNKIKELADKITQARHDYYNGQPTISDKEFDRLVDTLTKLDPNHPAVTSVGAPVIVSEWQKVKHSVAMGSLNKINTIDQLKKWASNCNATKFLLCEKLDGLSVSTQWENGKLVLGATRGDGHIGEDITKNVLRMKGIPEKLKKNFTGHLRGEILLKKSDHKEYFSEYANPRNAASGITKRFDSEGVEHLTVMMYKVEGKDFKTELDQFEFIDTLGVITTPYTYCGSIQDIIDVYELYSSKKREKLDWDIDGLVLRVLDMAEQEALGERNHRPFGQIAFKFEAEEAETILRNIVWQVGNSGRITPVGEFDTVELGGAKVSRASLYNYSYIKELGLDIGASIIVVRANDVIPRATEVTKPTGTIAKYPKKCPDCGHNTEMNGEYLICQNKATCPAQKVGRINSWINELNILDWSEKTVQKFIDAGLVNDVADLYKLKKEQIENLDRMGPKLAEKMIKILDGHREVSLHNFIGGLGIEGVATSTAKSVIDAGYDTVDAFLSMSISDFKAIPKFGDIRAEAFYNGLKENKNRIKDILEAGVKIKARPKGNLKNKSFCFSGSSSLPRTQLHQLVEDNGGNVKKNIGRDLDFLVLADSSSTSSKAEGARKIGVKIISEEEFMAML